MSNNTVEIQDMSLIAIAKTSQIMLITLSQNHTLLFVSDHFTWSVNIFIFSSGSLSSWYHLPARKNIHIENCDFWKNYFAQHEKIEKLLWITLKHAFSLISNNWPPGYIAAVSWLPVIALSVNTEIIPSY